MKYVLILRIFHLKLLMMEGQILCVYLQQILNSLLICFQLITLDAIFCLNKSSMIRIFNALYHSSGFLQSKPVFSCSIACLNAPILLAIVGTFTKAASNHSFSLFASLKMQFLRGTIFISIPANSSGIFFLSINFFIMI